MAMKNKIIANENEIYMIETVPIERSFFSKTYKSFTYKFGYKYNKYNQRYIQFNLCCEYEEMTDEDKKKYNDYCYNIVNPKGEESFLNIHLYYIDNKNEFDKILKYPIVFSLNVYYDDDFKNLKVYDYDGNRLNLDAGLNGLQITIDGKNYSYSKFNYKSLNLESRNIILKSLIYIKNNINNINNYKIDDNDILSYYIKLINY